MWEGLFETITGQSGGPETLPIPDFQEKPDYAALIGGVVAIAALLFVFYTLTKQR